MQQSQPPKRFASVAGLGAPSIILATSVTIGMSRAGEPLESDAIKKQRVETKVTPEQNESNTGMDDMEEELDSLFDFSEVRDDFEVGYESGSDEENDGDDFDESASESGSIHSVNSSNWASDTESIIDPVVVVEYIVDTRVVAKRTRGTQKTALSTNAEAIKKQKQRAKKRLMTLNPIALPTRLAPVEYNLIRGESIQELPLEPDEFERIHRENRMILLHLKTLALDILASKKACLHTIIVYFAGFALIFEMLEWLIDSYPSMSDQLCIDVLAESFLTQLQTPGLSTWMALRRSFRLYFEISIRLITDMKKTISKAEVTGTPTDNFKKLLAQYERFWKHPEANSNGMDMLREWGEMPMERRTAVSIGEHGSKQSIARHTQAIFIIIKISRCCENLKYDEDRSGMSIIGRQIKAKVGKSYKIHDTDRQRNKKHASMTNAQRLDVLKW
ncbi:hypothetical protein BCR33DRAFT_787858 [Rhizoclosmatium globosum]|uniref:Uncharacterized protein n=1 Tax=Rhizoclosmatium globosum TaxID=329046 RepID=A0A1Y2C0P6_9FUNG|nr:hypothetical protein BCR33DRAFT_787858 [Rhizoclosmatium globosum]|eukprot:ORY39885.1 hypothetical protein BCR33DRAFT_787858 [Rhizoclosmatium globosum]